MAPDDLRLTVLARHMMAESVYGRFADALAPLAIEHLVLKGPHLASIAYPRPEDRDFVDLDVLVRPEAVEPATEALVGAGFEREVISAERMATADAAYDRTFFSPQGFTVEVHHALAPHGMYALDTGELFLRAVPFRFGRRQARGLSVEDLLLHLVIHAAKSHFRHLEPKHLRDVRELVAHQPIDWGVFVARVTEVGARTAAWIFLSAAAAVESAEVPGHVLRELRPSKARRLWLRPWLRPRSFPLLRRSELPMWLARLVISPGMMDGVRQSARSVARFSAVRLRDAIGARGAR